MEVIVDHEFRFNPPQALVDALIPLVSFPNPERAKVAKSGRPFHHIPAEWCALERPRGDAQARLPRGCLPQLQEAARRAGVPLTWVSRVTYDPAAQVVPLERLAGTLRDYQVEAVEACAQKRQGVVTIACGGGKTRVGSALVIHLNQRAVVVTPSVFICQQWVDTIRSLYPSAKVRVVHGASDWSGAPLEPGEIAVGVDDSLAQDRARPMLASAGVLVTDETHRVASKTWRAIVAACPARWRIGLTATPERPDGWDVLLPVLLGPVLLERSQQWLVGRGYLAQPTVFGVATGVAAKGTDFRYAVTCRSCGKQVAVDPVKVQAGLERCRAVVVIRKKRDVCNAQVSPDAVVEKTFSVGKAGSRVADDPDRLDAVREIAAWAMARDRDVLVLTPRVAAVAKVVRALLEDGVPAAGLTGAEGPKVRARVLADIAARRVRVLVATQLADEGLDIPRTDTLVNTSAGVAAGNAAQRVGRICRPSGQAPVVFDFVDGGENYARQWRARALAYRRAYGEVAVPERKPIPLADVLARLGGAEVGPVRAGTVPLFVATR